MVNTDLLVELAPHYLAMLVLMFLALAVVRALVGSLGFWAELVVLLAIVTVYRPLVQRLGYAPSVWQK
jgi:hypothetical protein